MDWAFRCEYENKKHWYGAFITLTYSDDNVPYTTNSEGEIIQTLVKKDFQLFMKRLRKEQSKVSQEKIRFFACGEYGGKTLRPHYHALIWGVLPEVKKKIDTIWNLGYVTIGNIESHSIRYVTNYMMKKNVENPRGSQKYFTLMSRKPGIGFGYVEDNRSYYDFHEEDRLITDAVPEERPFLNRYYTSHLKRSQGALKQFREAKELHFNKKRSEQYMNAELHEPLDPLGWIKKQKQERSKASERKQKFNNQNKNRI